MHESLPDPSDQIAQLVDDLGRLARDEPKKLTAYLQQMTVKQQADLALRLDASERIALLMHSPKPMRLVRALPEQDWFLTVRELGPAESGVLLKLAASPQLIHLMDLESWRGDRFDEARAGAWLALLIAAGEAPVRRLLRDADETLLALILRRWLKLFPLEYEDGAEIHGHGLGDMGTEDGMTAPDGYHLFSPLNPEHAAAAQRIMQLFFVDQPERYQRACWAAIWELPSELEEQAYEWRCKRLEEYGYPPFDEALTVYAAPGTSVKISGPPPVEDQDGLGASRRALMPNWGPRDLAMATDRLDPALRERVLHETVALANRLLVADGADPGELLHHRAALIRASGYIGIAFQARGADEPAAIADRLAETPVVELFREGWSRAVALQTAARELLSEGWQADHPNVLAALDSPLDAQVAALLEKRPLFVDLESDTPDSSRRDFLSLNEIESTAAAIEMAKCVGELLFRELQWGGTADGETLRLSTIWLTSMAQHAVSSNIGTQPLSEPQLADFLRTVASRRTAAPESTERATEKWIRALADRFKLDARQLCLLQAFGRFAAERLIDECGQLDPGAVPDRRFVHCLILE